MLWAQRDASKWDEKAGGIRRCPPLTRRSDSGRNYVITVLQSGP